MEPIYIFLLTIPLLFIYAEYFPSSSPSEAQEAINLLNGHSGSNEEEEGDELRGMEFDQLVNFRDVGLFVNGVLGLRFMAEKKLFRSARLDDISIEDRQRLRVNYGIKTIIDLRSKTEHVLQQKKRQAYLKNPPQNPTNTGLALPIQIPGIKYIYSDIHGRKFKMNMMWKLKFWSILKMAGYILFGYRLEGIRILVKEACKPRGLIGLGYDTLDFCGAEIAELFTTLSHPGSYPLLIHCTQGKDRTGAIITLLLLLLSTPLPAIKADFRLSESELLPEKESRLKEIREIGLSDEFIGCPEDWVEKFEAYLGTRYSGVRGYLKGIGVGREVQERVVGVLRG